MKVLDVYPELLYDKTVLRIEIDNKDRMEVIDKIKAIEPVKGEYDIEIRKHHKKRSLDANAYMWVLADKIAQVVESTASEIYRKAIREVGTFLYIAVHDDRVEDLQRMWESNGTGWVSDVEPCSIPGSKNVKLYSGSSTYDTKQMARLIDYMVEEAKGLGIETMTPDEIAEIESKWRAA